MSRTTFVAAALALAVTLPIAPAQAAGVARTFVSAAGSDSNNCANVMTPCRHLATAYAATATNGEIYVLDPANYGALTITHGVSIEGHGWASIAPVVNGNAITIQANPTDKINIIGVVLDGTGLTGTTGIFFNSGGSLNVADSVIRNFSGSGIDIEPTGTGSMNGVLDHVRTEDNGAFGVTISPTIPTNITISDSVSANNKFSGINANSIGTTPVNVMVRNSTIANNGVNGLEAQNDGAIIRVTRSTITGNGFGWAISSGGIVTSYADNNIDGNTNANTEPPSPLPYH